ncbi:hypothetical protein P0Y35_16215 [Kiritimatiellaeota bacterium B1221]|nr:hypothetical protein [Kiritimatiellaeota bacterium B1221]
MKNSQAYQLESKDGKQTYVFEIKAGKLHYAWKHFGDAGSRTVQLASLSPDFGYQETFRGAPQSPFHVGVFATLVLLFFMNSDLQKHDRAVGMILAGAVALIGFLFALIRLPKVRHSYIMSKKDVYVVSLDHRYFEGESLECFLLNLKEAIEQADTGG